MPADYYNRKSRKPGDLSKLRVKLWRVIEALEKAMEETKDREELARLSYAFTNAAREYRSNFEVTELEPRLQALEEKLENRK